MIRPSGEVLPLVLRKKYNEQIDSKAAEGEGGNKEAKKKKVLVHPAVDGEEINSVFTAEELENKMIQASQCMVEIQKQLYRGEEIYVEDTHAHGNLFRGWDTFIDLRDITAPTSQPGATRRVPADNRWFSGSCKSVARGSRPLSRASMTPTPTIRSTAATPVSVGATPPKTPPAQATIEPVAAAPAAATVAVTQPPKQVMQTIPKKLAITAPVKSPEPAADAPATPLRRNSARKRKQGET